MHVYENINAQMNNKSFLWKFINEKINKTIIMYIVTSYHLPNGLQKKIYKTK